MVEDRAAAAIGEWSSLPLPGFGSEREPFMRLLARMNAARGT